MANEEFGLIYKFLNVKNQKCYIGQAVNLPRRKSNHITRLRRNVHTNPHLQSAFNKYGEDSFYFIVLEDGIPVAKLANREIFWVKFLEPEYNIAARGGIPMYGRKQTKEAIEKIGNASKGNKNTLGMKHSEETKAKMRISSPHRKHTDEFRTKIGQLKKGNKYTLGYKHSEESCRNMSQSMMGNKNSLGFKHTPETCINMSNAQSNRKAVKQIDSITNEVIRTWPGIAWAARETGVNRVVIIRVVNGKGHTAGGYKWEFA